MLNLYLIKGEQMMKKNICLFFFILFLGSKIYSGTNPEIDKFNIIMLKFKSGNIPPNKVDEYNIDLKDNLELSGNLIVKYITPPEEFIFDNIQKIHTYRNYLQKLKNKQNISYIFTGTFNYEEGELVTKYYLINAMHSQVELNNKKSSIVKESIIQFTNRKISIEIISYLFDRKSTSLFFSSLLFPGLGQLKAGNKIKGLFYLAATGGILSYIYYIGKGNDYDTSNLLRIETYENEKYYIFGNKYISEEDYTNEIQKNIRAKETREKASKLRNRAILLGAFIYLLNIYDIMKITNKLDTDKLQQKFYRFGFNFNEYEYRISLNLDLNRVF